MLPRTPAAPMRRAGVRILGDGEVLQGKILTCETLIDDEDGDDAGRDAPRKIAVSARLVAFLIIVTLLVACVQLFLLGVDSETAMQAGAALRG